MAVVEDGGEVGAEVGEGGSGERNTLMNGIYGVMGWELTQEHYRREAKGAGQ